MVSCDRCPRTLQDTATLQRHREMHVKGTGIECPKCPRVYESERTLKIHHTKMHNESLSRKRYECTECGDEVVYNDTPSTSDRAERYCSDCWNAAGDERSKPGSENPLWRGGHDGYRGPEWNERREEVLERDGYECVVCEADKKLVVHHVVAYRHFGDKRLANLPNNLETMCRSCHSTIENAITRTNLGAVGQRELMNRGKNTGTEAMKNAAQAKVIGGGCADA